MLFLIDRSKHTGRILLTDHLATFFACINCFVSFALEDCGVLKASHVLTNSGYVRGQRLHQGPVENEHFRLKYLKIAQTSINSLFHVSAQTIFK